MGRPRGTQFVVICKTCEREFNSSSTERVYCSAECRRIDEGLSKFIICECGTKFKPEKYGRKFCSTKCAQKYAVRQNGHKKAFSAQEKQAALDVADCVPTGDYKQLLLLYKKKEWSNINMLIRRVCALKKILEVETCETSI